MGRPSPTSPTVGDRLEIYWSQDDQYYSGTIVARLPRYRYHILYDDGDSENLRLRTEKWRFLPPLPAPSIQPRTSANVEPEEPRHVSSDKSTKITECPAADGVEKSSRPSERGCTKARQTVSIPAVPPFAEQEYRGSSNIIKSPQGLQNTKCAHPEVTVQGCPKSHDSIHMDTCPETIVQQKMSPQPNDLSGPRKGPESVCKKSHVAYKSPKLGQLESPYQAVNTQKKLSTSYSEGISSRRHTLPSSGRAVRFSDNIFHPSKSISKPLRRQDGPLHNANNIQLEQQARLRQKKVVTAPVSTEMTTSFPCKKQTGKRSAPSVKTKSPECSAQVIPSNNDHMSSDKSEHCAERVPIEVERKVSSPVIIEKSKTGVSTGHMQSINDPLIPPFQQEKMKPAYPNTMQMKDTTMHDVTNLDGAKNSNKSDLLKLGRGSLVCNTPDLKMCQESTRGLNREDASGAIQGVLSKSARRSLKPVANEKFRPGNNVAPLGPTLKPNVIPRTSVNKDVKVKDDNDNIFGKTPFERLKYGVKEACMLSIQSGLDPFFKGLEMAKDSINVNGFNISSEVDKHLQRQQQMEKDLESLEKEVQRDMPGNKFEKAVQTKLNKFGEGLNSDVREGFSKLRETVHQHVSAGIQEAKLSKHEIMKELQGSFKVAVEDALQKSSLSLLVNSKLQEIQMKVKSSAQSNVLRDQNKKKTNMFVKGMPPRKRGFKFVSNNTKKSRIQRGSK